MSGHFLDTTLGCSFAAFAVVDEPPTAFLAPAGHGVPLITFGL
jgi:hypothetical protein